MDTRRLATGVAALFSFFALVTTLAWPVVTADRDPIEWTEVEEVVSPPRIDVIDEEGISDTGLPEVALLSGELNDRAWVLSVGADPEWFCYTFHVIGGPDRQGVGCSEVGSDGAGSMFAPAGTPPDLGRSVLVAVLPEAVARVGLRVTNDFDADIHLARAPHTFEHRVVFLVAFLPEETDIIDARALDADGRPVDIARVEDQVNAY